MEKNILDKAVDKTIDMLLKVNDKVKNEPYYPFGKVPATRAEKQKQFENLDINTLSEMIQKYGRDAVNEYLGKYMRR
jgi:hypothetical protein